MVSMRPGRFHFIFIFAMVLAPWIALAGYRLLPESSPVARGASYAQTKPCINCHGDPDRPQLDEIEESCSNHNEISGHPDYDVECSDAMAYFESVRILRSFKQRKQARPDSPLIAGESLAREYHCFQCHGQLGQGGFKNAKSLKGYIPGYFGKDFKILTNNADPKSVRKWIKHGLDKAVTSDRFTGRAAKYFLEKQAVSMPSFKSLDPDEIETLVNYVIALHKLGPMTAETIRIYGEG